MRSATSRAMASSSSVGTTRTATVALSGEMTRAPGPDPLRRASTAIAHRSRPRRLPARRMPWQYTSSASRAPGSRSPARVPITRPADGVEPIEVSTLAPAGDGRGTGSVAEVQDAQVRRVQGLADDHQPPGRFGAREVSAAGSRRGRADRTAPSYSNVILHRHTPPSHSTVILRVTVHRWRRRVGRKGPSRPDHAVDTSEPRAFQ
jgi:hypothetical protein